jgi:hypothetical protein
MKHSHRRNLIALGISTILHTIPVGTYRFHRGTPLRRPAPGARISLRYPLTLQNLMHLFFFIGLGQLFV